MPTELETYTKELHDAVEFVKERVPSPEEWQRIVKSVEDTKKVADELAMERRIKRADDGKVRVRDGKFAGYTSFDLSMLGAVLQDRINRRRMVGFERDLLAEADKAQAELGAQYRSYEAIERWESGALDAVKSITAGNVKVGRHLKDGIAAWREDMQRQMMQRKAMDSTTAGAGDELVPTFETAELWMDVNLATNILPTLRQIPMPTEPYDIPLQFGDVNWYPIAQNVEGTTTDPTTAKSTLSAKGLKAGIPFSDELNEDSIVPFIPNLRSSLVRNAAEVIDDVLLNADQTAVNGINSDGATIDSSTAGKAHWLLGFDGIRHLPLVDNTDQNINVNAALSAANTYNALLRRLGKYAAFQVRGDVVYIGNVQTVIASLALDEVETVDKLGVRATISSGELASVYGIPLIMSEQFRLADTDGLVTDAGNSADTGAVVALNTTQWYVGFRRGITLETEREAGKGQTTLWAHMRPALVARGDRDSATHTAIARNITGVS